MFTILGKLIPVWLLVLLLSGCGFQLRGQVQLPPAMEVSYVKSEDPHSPLTRGLKRALEAGGATVTEDSEAATATIAILTEDLRRRTLAVGPRGEQRDYELRYTADYTVSLADETQPIPREALSVTRNLLYDEADVLGRAEGEEMVIREMASDLAWSIIRRVQIMVPGRP